MTAPHPHQPLFDKLEEVRAEWPGLCSNPKLLFDKEKDWVIQSCQKSDYAMKLALGNLEATANALRNAGAIGVTLDPARKLAYVLPRDGKMIYDLSYMGLIDVAITSGCIKWAQARRVYANEVYEPVGYDAPPVHRRKPFATREERGNVIGAYVVVKTPDGDYLTDEMSIEEINDIRGRSQSYKEYLATKDQANPKKSPWVSDEAEMQKKTVVKHAYKYWPRSERLDQAIHYLNTDGGQGIDLTPEDESKTRISIWTEKVKAATTGEEVAAVWKQAREECKAKEDMPAYEAIKAEVAAKNRALGVTPPANGNGTAPAATPAPTPAPHPEPGSGSTRAAAPTAPPTRAPAPTPAPSPEAIILSDIAKVSGDDAQAAYDALNAIAERIDASPQDLQAELNEAWNSKLAAIKAKHGHA